MQPVLCGRCPRVLWLWSTATGGSAEGENDLCIEVTESLTRRQLSRRRNSCGLEPRCCNSSKLIRWVSSLDLIPAWSCRRRRVDWFEAETLGGWKSQIDEVDSNESRRMLKTITSSLPALHESSYTVVDVKFETGQNPAMDAVAHHLEDSNIFQQHQEFCDDDEEEVLQTPNSSPPQEAVNNKRKRSVPKKFSVDEDENPMHQVIERLALTCVNARHSMYIQCTLVFTFLVFTENQEHEHEHNVAWWRKELLTQKMIETICPGWKGSTDHNFLPPWKWKFINCENWNSWLLHALVWWHCSPGIGWRPQRFQKGRNWCQSLWDLHHFFHQRHCHLTMRSASVTTA